MEKKTNSNLKPVESNIEGMNEQIRLHRKSLMKRILCVVGVVLVLLAGTKLWLEIRTFSSYTILSNAERSDSDAVEFESFGNYILKYSNDGATLMNGQNTQVWNQSYEMTNPCVSIANEYAAIYDRGSIGIYIVSQTNTVNHIEMTNPILSVSVSDLGSVAVLMKENDVTIVRLFDRNGGEIAHGDFYQENGGFPVDIALSFDGKKMAIDMVDVSDGNLQSTITFYNFGSVGQNEINNNVGVFSYSEMFIPEIEFVSDDRMVALGDNEVVIFEGEEKPGISSEIFIDSEVECIVYDEKHVAVISVAEGNSETKQLALYDMKGKVVMEIETELIYEDAYFLENGELCLMNDTECEIYTTHRVKKFSYTFDHVIYRILSQNSKTQYIFIFDDSTQEVRLK